MLVLANISRTADTDSIKPHIPHRKTVHALLIRYASENCRADVDPLGPQTFHSANIAHRKIMQDN
jgi:hypothetical protein